MAGSNFHQLWDAAVTNNGKRSKLMYMVTGGTGFLGSYVVRDLLAEGHEVVCFQRSGITTVIKELVSKDLLKKVNIVRGSVADSLDLFTAIREYNVDTIIHLAYALYPESEIPQLSLRVNVIGTNNVFEAARLFKLKKVVWTSTMGIFGNIGQVSDDKVLSDEAVLPRPSRLYGATKVLNEFVAELYYQQFGVNSVCLRLGRTYGIGKVSGSVSEFTGLLEKVALGKPATILNGDGKSTYIYVDDAVKAIIKACTVQTSKRILNVGNGVYYNGWQVADVIRKIRPDARIEVKPGIGVYDLPKLDVAPSLKELGLIPRSLKEGIEEMMNSYRQQN